MPVKPPRNKPPFRNSGTPRSAASLLQRITRQAGVNPLSNPKVASRPPLLERLRLSLPEDDRPHLLEVRQNDPELVFFADSAAWAARLRLALVDLAARLPDPELPELTQKTRFVIRLMPRQGFRR